MGSLIEELQRREFAAREEAGGLREEIAKLRERLVGVEERLSRLVIAREMVEEVLDEAGARVRAPVEAPETVAGSPVGVLTVPAWRRGLSASVLPQVYRDVLEVCADAGGPVRAGQVAARAGLSTDKSKIEGLRSKLKRLVERGWLDEQAGPGLFALPARPDAEDMSKPG